MDQTVKLTMQHSIVNIEEAIQFGAKYNEIYLPFMLNAMNEVCIRSTLMILKDSWMKHLNEFDGIKDMSIVRKILKEFPETITRNEVNCDDLDSICFDNLFEEDVRSSALVLFSKMWDITNTFFQSPPSIFYTQSKRFFESKISI